MLRYLHAEEDHAAVKSTLDEYLARLRNTDKDDVVRWGALSPKLVRAHQDAAAVKQAGHMLAARDMCGLLAATLIRRAVLPATPRLPDLDAIGLYILEADQLGGLHVPADEDDTTLWHEFTADLYRRASRNHGRDWDKWIECYAMLVAKTMLEIIAVDPVPSEIMARDRLDVEAYHGMRERLDIWVHVAMDRLISHPCAEGIHHQAILSTVVKVQNAFSGGHPGVLAEIAAAAFLDVTRAGRPLPRQGADLPEDFTHDTADKITKRFEKHINDLTTRVTPPEQRTEISNARECLRLSLVLLGQTHRAGEDHVTMLALVLAPALCVLAHWRLLDGQAEVDAAARAAGTGEWCRSFPPRTCSSASGSSAPGPQ